MGNRQSRSKETNTLKERKKERKIKKEWDKGKELGSRQCRCKERDNLKERKKEIEGKDEIKRQSWEVDKSKSKERNTLKEREKETERKNKLVVWEQR